MQKSHEFRSTMIIICYCRSTNANRLFLLTNKIIVVFVILLNCCVSFWLFHYVKIGKMYCCKQYAKNYVHTFNVLSVIKIIFWFFVCFWVDNDWFPLNMYLNHLVANTIQYLYIHVGTHAILVFSILHHLYVQSILCTKSILSHWLTLGRNYSLCNLYVRITLNSRKEQKQNIMRSKDS